MLILEAVEYATARINANVPAATNWIWRRDCDAYLALREWDRDTLAGKLLDLTLAGEPADI